MQKLKDKLRAQTKRNNGQSLACILGQVNRTLRGWFGFFQHSCRLTFRDVDSWLRGRLRSLLRRRAGGRGHGRGRDQQRWPNAFFAAQGYHSLTLAHAQARQSPWG
jgi:RNA-directed DNA polymerase